MNKKKIHFDIEYFQGMTCVGCPVIEDLAMEVEFTDDEIQKMKQLVADLDEVLYSEGIMPVLKDAAPNLYKRIDDAARNEIFDFLVVDGIRQGYIEFDEDELRRNFEKDIMDSSFEFIPSDYYDLDEHPSEEELKEKEYEVWYDNEFSNICSDDLDYIRSRYNVDDHVDLEDNPEYTVDIPSEFLPE